MKHLILLLFFNISFSQISPNSLFFVVDKNSKNIRHFKPSQIRYNYYSKINFGYNLFLVHNQDENDKFYTQHYKLELPQSLFKDFQEQGNVVVADTIEKKWDTISYEEFYESFQKHYPPYFRPFYQKIDNHYKKGCLMERYNVFLVFLQDLGKDYIPCYEAYMGTLVERDE